MTLNKKSIIQHICHDLRIGLVGQWKKYAAAAVVFAVICGDLFSRFQSALTYATSEMTSSTVSFGDDLFYLFRGMPEAVPGDPEMEINFFWVLIFILLAYIVSYYPFKDLSGYGQQMLLRSQKRGYWWLSKCIWNVFSVISFYLIAFLIAALFAILLGGDLSLLPHNDIQLYLNHFSFPELTPAMVLLLTLCLPLSVSITLSLIQMTVSLILNPIFGMITSAAILATSIFFNSQWILGNYLMVIRSQALSLQGLLLCPILCAVSILIGYFYFQKRDILSQYD